MNDRLSQLTEIFRDVLENEDIQINTGTSAKDIEEWDSLNHIVLVVEIEKVFEVKFDTSEIASWQNVGDILSSIENKKG